MNNNIGKIPLHVLILEDSEDDALLLERELKQSGYQIFSHRIETETALLDALAEQSWQLIIADYALTDFNGLEALKLIREKGLDIPFIVVSGYLSEESAVEAMRAGAHDFIIKGKTARLLPAIERELREAHQRATQREMEARFQRSEERLKLAIEAANITVWEWDVEQDRVVYGDHYENLFGIARRSPEEKTEDLMERIHPEDRERVLEAVKATLQDDVPLRLEYRVIWMDDSIHWLQSHGHVSRNRQGKPVSMMGVLQNITDHKRVAELEMNQRRLQSMVEKQQELARLQSRFMAMVAHEFRTPLTVISSANELLYEYYDELSKEKHKEYLAEIAERVRYLREMLTQIETVTREEHVPTEFLPHPTDVVALCSRVIRDVQLDFDHSHPIRLVHEPGFSEINIDGRLLGQILINLLNNAVKYSRKGSEILVQLTLCLRSNCLEIKVSDHGVGILPEDQPHIFELFFRGANIGAVNGRGIGLKIVQDCVEAHHGSIDVSSEVGKGTTFTIRLPAGSINPD